MSKSLSLLFLLIVMPPVASATSTEIERGPPATVTKRVERHLYDIYVTPPKATKSYSSTEIWIYLRREYPDYMHVRLAHEAIQGGRLRARVAISPEREGTYSVYVYDHRKDRDLLLFKGNLNDLGAE